jgi:surface polysaccharide O-acyltransferase-like enzyme
MALRNPNIDALRLLAALGVIALHVGPYVELSSITGEFIRTSARWCVPVFFMITGYFLTSANGEVFPSVTLDRITRPAFLFLMSSLLFLPLLLKEQRLSELHDPGILIIGTYFHTWYLSALVVGLIGCNVATSYRLQWLAIVVGVLIVALYLAASYSAALGAGGGNFVPVLREISAMPFLIIGAQFRRFVNVGSAIFATTIAFGLVALVTEVLIIDSLGGHAGEAQLTVSGMVIAAGLLGLAITSTGSVSDTVASIGQKESLGIYIYHPFIILVARKLLKLVHPAAQPTLAVAAITALLTVCLLVFLRRMFPTLRDIADGMLQSKRAVAARYGQDP